MLIVLLLLGIILYGVGHIWCQNRALDEQGAVKWAWFDIWLFVLSDWESAREPFKFMGAGAIIIIVSLGLHYVGIGDLGNDFHFLGRILRWL